MVLCTQVELREGWPWDRSTAQRLPFNEDQWRRKLLKSIIGHLSKAQNVRRVIKLTEHAMDGAWLLYPSLPPLRFQSFFMDSCHS